MILNLLKVLKETSFYKRKKEIMIKTWTFTKEKFILRRKEEHEFSDKGKVDIMDFSE